MKKFWMNSLPLLVVLFVLTIGFTMFNNLDASPSDTNDPCADLEEICRQEANYALSHAKSMAATPIGVKMPEKMQRRLVTPL